MGRVVGADHHHFLAGVGVWPAVLGRMLLLALEDVLPLDLRHVGLARHAGGKHQVLGADDLALAVALYRHFPFLLGRVVARVHAVGGRPVVHLHHLGVHLQPVADLVLGREHRPVGRKRQVRQVVVPHRVVQAQRLVAAAPLVARAGVAVNHDVRHAQLPQPRAQRDTALPAADHQHEGLLFCAQAGGLVVPALQPGLAAALDAVLGPHRAARVHRLFVALEFLRGRQQRPDAPVLDAHVAVAARVRRVDGDPGRRHAVGRIHLLVGVDAEHRRFDGGELGIQHVLYRGGAFQGFDVPGEQHQVAPIRFGGEQRRRGVGIARCQRPVELVEQCLHARAGRVRLARGCSGRRRGGKGFGHVVSFFGLEPAAPWANGLRAFSQGLCHTGEGRQALFKSKT